MVTIGGGIFAIILGLLCVLAGLLAEITPPGETSVSMQFLTKRTRRRVMRSRVLVGVLGIALIAFGAWLIFL